MSAPGLRPLAVTLLAVALLAVAAVPARADVPAACAAVSGTSVRDVTITPPGAVAFELDVEPDAGYTVTEPLARTRGVAVPVTVRGPLSFTGTVAPEVAYGLTRRTSLAGDAIVLGAGLALALRGLHGATATVRIDLWGGADIETRIPCEALAPTPDRTPESLPEETDAAGTRSLEPATAASLVLRDRPGGKPIARIDAPPAFSVEAALYGTSDGSPFFLSGAPARHGWVEVSYDVDSVEFHGWVRAREVTSASPPAALGALGVDRASLAERHAGGHEVALAAGTRIWDKPGGAPWATTAAIRAAVVPAGAGWLQVVELPGIEQGSTADVVYGHAFVRAADAH